MGATLYEPAPDAPEMRMHMHFGAEEMFFVLRGRPTDILSHTDYPTNIHHIVAEPGKPILVHER